MLKKDPILITKICLIVICGAFAFSFINAALSSRVQAQVSKDELPSWRNMDAKIPNSDGLPRITLGGFLEKIAKTTGIYAFINNYTYKETTILDEATGKFKTT